MKTNLFWGAWLGLGAAGEAGSFFTTGTDTLSEYAWHLMDLPNGAGQFFTLAITGLMAWFWLHLVSRGRV